MAVIQNIRPCRASDSFILSDMMWEWLKSVRHNLKPNTFQKYDSVIRNHIETHTLGKSNIRFVTSKTLSDFANQKAESGLSVKTVNDIQIVIGLALSYAEEVYQIQRIKVNFLKERPKEMRVLDLSEQKHLKCF